MSKTMLFVVVGSMIGALALALGYYGNPPNMGVCVACFMRDVAGGMRLHSAAPVQYMRPEIFGFILGAFAAVLLAREFKPAAGSAPFLRFSLGFFMMIGCLVFLGCPLRMMLRIAGGDLNAIIGLAGFVTGIGIGALFLKNNFSLTPSAQQQKSEGILFPLLCLVLLLLVLAQGGLFASSEKGPGAQHAPIWMSLLAGLVIGAIVQRTRFCFIGMFSHVFLFRRFSMLIGVIALTLVMLVGNLMLGKFHLGFENQPIAHTDGLWNFLSLALVGLCGAFISGCPLRQLVQAGQGNSDATMTVLGLLVGAAFAHNFSLASSAAGPTAGGKIVLIVGLIFALFIGVMYTRFAKKNPQWRETKTT